MDAPLARRRARLADVLAGAAPQLTLSPHTTDADEAADWLATWTAAGIEGVVAKRSTPRVLRPGSSRRRRPPRRITRFSECPRHLPATRTYGSPRGLARPE
ncbi:ATP-dependent DNA ligase [Micromonospora sp. MW-13]|nr:ATP-dependent DNA ligase [Micromonospora sp. MW-13]